MVEGRIEARDVIDRMIDSNKINRKNILVIGDAMTDLYVCGKRTHTCQEDCPKFVETGRVICSGGAANAAHSITEWNVFSSSLYPPHLGPMKTRYIDEFSKCCIFRADDDSVKIDLNVVRDECLFTLAYDSTPIDGVLLSDYDKGLLTPEFIRNVVEQCATKGIPCVADAKRHPRLYEGTTLKCNIDYAKKHLDYLLREKNRYNHSVITVGASYPDIIGQYDSMSAPAFTSYKKMNAVNCVNHVGAGDCFAAHLLLAMTHKLTMKESVLFAYCAGRAYVQKPFNTPPKPSEVLQAAQ